MTKKKIKLAGLHCVSCCMVIEGELEDSLGVKSKCNYAKQEAEVEYDETKISAGQITATIEKQGYKVVGYE